MKICKLKPALVSYIWGGKKLHENFNKDKGENVGETWEVSYDDEYPCLIGSGENTGKRLKDIASKEDIGSNSSDMPFFPLLIKFIDALDNLSIQVHPSDDYALKNENQYGKTEMWYVLDAEEGAKICYGAKEEIDRNEFLDLMKSGEICEKLNFVDTKKGDVFFVKSGTIHAIGSGATIYEVQQNSRLTYRLYDYLRKDSEGNYRELHLKKAQDVSNLLPINESEMVKAEKVILIDDENNYLEKKVIGYSKYFVTYELTFSGNVETDSSKNTFLAMTCVEGNGSLNEIDFVCGDTIFIPANSGKLNIEGKGKFVVSKVSKFYMGIDIGGTAIKGGLFTDDGEILNKLSVSTESALGSEKVIQNSIKLCKKLLVGTTISMENISGIGMGIPGGIDSKNGIVLYSNNLHWKDVKIKEEMQNALGVEVRITNDANAAALGEASFGNASDVKNSVLITLGTGIGAGIIIDGKLFEGGYSLGGEIGHTVIHSGGGICTCGRRGCFEVYSSATALIRETKQAMLENKDSKLWEIVNGDIEKVNGKTSFELAKTDKTAKKVVDDYIENLAIGLTNVANIFRPEIILLGGGISKEGDNLVLPLQEKLNEKIYGGNNFAPVKIKVAKLGNNAGMFGGLGLFVE